jgi:hypothetical protein
MRQPPGFVKRGKEDHVYELIKSLYGLKHAPRIWYAVLHAALTELGFTRCHKEYCIYVQKVGDEWVIIVVYVDDLTIMSRNITLLQRVKDELSRRFKIKDLGDIHYILKMEVRRNRAKRVMTICQTKYINDLLIKYKMENCTVAATPQAVSMELQPKTQMSPEQIANQPFDYRGLIGSLQFLVRGTRPDIANAVHELSKYLSCYNETHWTAARRVLKYFKGTSTYGLYIDGNKRDVLYEVYTDASFTSQSKDRKSVTGYLISMACTTVS